MNLDYRILTLLLACATREDLLDDYASQGGSKLEQLGIPMPLLDQARYIFQDATTKTALQQTQVAMQTLVNLNDYCVAGCPSDPILSQLISYTAQLGEPVQQAGVED